MGWIRLVERELVYICVGGDGIEGDGIECKLVLRERRVGPECRLLLQWQHGY